MSNSFGKVLVVFAATASVAFAAFAGAIRSGGPNWWAEIDDLGTDFYLNINPGEKTTYTLTHRQSGAAGRSSPVLAEVVTEAKAKQIAVAKEQLNKLSGEVEQLKPQIEAANAAAAVDEASLKQREDDLLKQLNEVSQQIARLNDDIIEKTADAQKIRSESQERREEVYRSRNQLELLRNDLFSTKVQRKNLEEESLRLKAILQRLERRKHQLSTPPASY